MKNTDKILGAALAGLLLIGCNDLDTMPNGDIVTQYQKDEALARDPATVRANVTGIATMFSVLNNVFGGDVHTDFGYPSVMLYLDSRGADMPSFNLGYNWYASSQDFSDISVTSRPTRLIWGTMYNQIYSVNLVTKNISEDTADPTLQFYLANALTFRAFDYFVLAQLYQFSYAGNEEKPCVPIITEANQDDAAAVGCPRSTVYDVYARILSDLNKAISLFESSGMARPDKRYADVNVAHGLRARVHLVMNSWAEAADDAAYVIENSDAYPYTLDEVSAPAFSNIADHSWLWGILISEQDEVTTSGIVNFPSHMGSLNYGYASVGAWRMINIRLYNMIPDTDVRKGWWLDEDGYSPNLLKTYNSPNLDASLTALDYVKMLGCPSYTQVKFAPYKNELYTDMNACDVPLMRIEEMYLILAEAKAMSGDPGAASQLLQSFVSIYRNPAYVFSSADAGEVQQEVWTQRRIELWGEGMSYYDILRLNKGVDRRGGGFPAEWVYNVSAGDQALIYRIPQAEEQANPLLGGNNPVATKPTPVNE